MDKYNTRGELQKNQRFGVTDSALLIKFETYIEGMKKLDFATLTQAVLDCIRSYDEETKVIREVQRIMSDEDDSD